MIAGLEAEDATPSCAVRSDWRGVGELAGYRTVGAQGCAELGSSAEIENLSSAAAHRGVGFVETGVIRCFKKSL